MIRFCVRLIAAGRLPETGADLCSQPTMCRLENLQAPSRAEPAEQVSSACRRCRPRGKAAMARAAAGRRPPDGSSRLEERALLLHGLMSELCLAAVTFVSQAKLEETARH